MKIITGIVYMVLAGIIIPIILALICVLLIIIAMLVPALVPIDFIYYLVTNEHFLSINIGRK